MRIEESTVYNTNLDTAVWVDRDGTVSICSAGAAVYLDVDEIEEFLQILLNLTDREVIEVDDEE